MNLPKRRKKIEAKIPAELPGNLVHRFLLLFLRLDGKKTGALTRKALEDIAYMPFGVLAAEIQKILAISSFRS